MEPVNSSSLGAMGSLLKKLDELLNKEERAQGLIGDLRIISTKMEKLSEVHSPSHTVKYWMNDARELSYDMEVCVDKFVHASQPEDLPAKLAWIFTWHKEILGFAARVKEVNERCERYNLVPNSPTKVIASHQLQTLWEETDPVGMEEPTNKLVEWLMLKDHGEDEDKLSVVSVLGDGGVGKSTLVKRLWRVSEDSKFQFVCRAFVQTAKKPDTRMILRSILSQVHPRELPKYCSKVPNLINDLRERLQDKRYFIVIDDLWDISVWNIVRRAFPKRNCRIITTTTVEKVARACCSYDRNNIVNVKCLHGDQPKKLFVDRAFGSEKGCPTQFNDITDEITGKCGGLPLAIICTARLVANQPETEQGQQLDYVNKFLPSYLRTQSSCTEILTEVLNLCYSSLPCSLRTCMLYLSMYPENYLFLKEDLVKQWMAEDFICAADGNDVAGIYFDELISLGMIQRMDMNKKGLLAYTVHPVVLDFIRCKSMEDNFVTTIDYSQSTTVLTENVRRLSLHFGSATYATTPACVELSQVRSLSFMGLLGCMPSLPEFMLVRVVILHVHSDDEDTKFSLAEICNLRQLRYLQVRCNVSVDLPHQMQSLKYLETVEINAGVEYVPSDIFQLSGLLHVRLGRKRSQTPTLCSVDCSSVPSPAVFLQSFELLPPICIFSRLPLWFRELHKLRILKIVVRKLANNITDALEELPVLAHLSFYVRAPTGVSIIFRKDMFPALEYFKFVCGVLSLGFLEGTLPNLRKLKLAFNAHKGEQYRNMLAGLSHLLSVEKVVASIGLAPDAVESDRTAAESAFNSIMTKHPRHQSFKVMKKVDQIDEDDDPSAEQSGSCIQKEKSANSDAVESDRTAAESAFNSTITKHPRLLKLKKAQIFCNLNKSQVDEDDVPPMKLSGSYYIQNEEPANSSVSNMLLDMDFAKRGESGQVPLWKLVFKTPPRLPIFGGSMVKDEAGNPLEVILVDADMASPTALPQELRVELVPVIGDFPPDGRKTWSADEFQRNVVKRPLLTGDVRLTMRDGRATVGEFQFTDNSSWFPWRKLRIGARVVPGSYDGGRIAEALTKAFKVRQGRADLYRKHYAPSPDDDVWRLKNIGKEGMFHRKLRQHNIGTVQEFLRMLTVKPQELRAILGDGMTDRMWEATTTHARSCVPGNALYVYRTPLGAIYVDSVFNLVKVEMGGIECPLPQLNTGQTMLVRQLLLDAYEHRNNLMDAAKDYPPSLCDSVWALQHITKDSTFHNNLESSKIKTVQEFLWMLMVKPDQLREILGDHMTDRMWEETSRHARTCVPGDKVYAYTARGCTIYVNTVFNLVKVEIDDVECPLQQLNSDQKALVLELIVEAYEHRHNLLETKAVPFEADATVDIPLLRSRFAAARSGELLGNAPPSRGGSPPPGSPDDEYKVIFPVLVDAGTSDRAPEVKARRL